MPTIILPSDAESCARNIDVTIRNVFSRLEELSALVGGIWERTISEQRQPRSRDLAPIRSKIDSFILAPESCMQGAGVVLEPGVLEDVEMYLEWLRVLAPNKTAPLTLNFNQHSESFYNYRNMPWFTLPKTVGQNALVGPYVDLYGTDMYILTFSIPIRVGGRFVGIAGADIAVNRFERPLLSALLKLDNEALIVSEEGRVIVANTASWMVGDMAKHAFNRSENGCKQVEVGGEVANWTLVERSNKRKAA